MICLASLEGRKRHALRKQTVEPVDSSARARQVAADAAVLSRSTSHEIASLKPTCRRSGYAIFHG